MPARGQGAPATTTTVVRAVAVAASALAVVALALLLVLAPRPAGLVGGPQAAATGAGAAGDSASDKVQEQGDGANPAPTAARGLARGPGGCLQPVKWHSPSLQVEKPDPREWQAGGAGDRLGEDPCGNVWALWFNSWTVFESQGSGRYGYVELSSAPQLASLSQAGVASFLATPIGELWLLGRNGELARYRGQGWERLPARQACYNGQLQRFDGELWLACGQGETPLWLWDETAGDWQPRGQGLGEVTRLAVSPSGRLLALGGGALREYRGGRGAAAWPRLADAPRRANAFVAGDERIYVGGDEGLRWFDRAGKPLGEAFAGKRVTGIAPDRRGGVWVALWMEGLHHHDGTTWRAWRYAHGLPDDEARDLLLDGRGRLWLAGTQTAMLSEAVAAERIAALATPAPVPGSVHADACAAAAELLGSEAESGQVARAWTEGTTRVFFAGVQVCPYPPTLDDTAHLFARRGDGALLEVGYNGSRGYRSCGGPCVESQQAQFAPLWQVVVHGADGQRRVLAPPQPVPEQTPHHAFLLTADDQVWVATRDAGLYQHDGRGWRRHGPAAGFGPGNLVYALVEAPVGTVWVASYPAYRPKRGYAGAALLRWRTGGWSRFPPAAAAAQFNSARTFADSPEGLLLATGNGVVRLTGDGALATTESPPGTSFISSLAVDPEGRWWMTHAPFRPGLSFGRAPAWHRLTTRDGLFDDRLAAIAHDGQHRVWLLAEDGRVAVHRRADLQARVAPGPGQAISVE